MDLARTFRTASLRYLNFGTINILPDSLLGKFEEIVKAVLNVKGTIRVVAGNKNFVKTVKEKGINRLAGFIEAT